MFVNTINIKNQKNVSILDTTFKLNKLTKANSMRKSKLKRLTLNVNKSSLKIILFKRKRDKFRKIKSNDKIKNT